MKIKIQRNNTYKSPKKMENNYYSPEILEFHVGFEYEWKRDGEGMVPWTKALFDTKANPFDVDSQRGNDYRVKYLDKEDIESLGYKEIFKDLTSTVFSKNYKDPRSNSHKSYIIINNFNQHVLISEGNDNTTYHDWLTRFSGQIKNKSELKTILKQCVIN